MMLCVKTAGSVRCVLCAQFLIMPRGDEYRLPWRVRRNSSDETPGGAA